MAVDGVDVTFGRFGETAMWILVALARGPRLAVGMLADVRSLDGNVRPGKLFGAVARLERRGLIESVVIGDRQPAYRLSRRWRGDQVDYREGLAR
jgi:DNA-binding PadR family transcriptional regulator